MDILKNSIVCVFDSWQYNYTGCYGNDWIKTPNFDRFAREGVLFENAYSNNLPTLPVRRSMMTGRITLVDTGWGPLRHSDITIADLLDNTGIDTAIVYDTPVMRIMRSNFARSYAYAKFNRGFDASYNSRFPLLHRSVDDFYTDPGFLERLRAYPDGAIIEKFNRHEYEEHLKDKQYWKSADEHSVAMNIGEAIKWLENADKNHAFHLWIDSWDPHEPWDPPSMWVDGLKNPYDPDYTGVDIMLPPMAPVKDLLTEEQMHHIRMMYAENLTLCDTYFGKLMDIVRKLGYEQNTLVWLSSDHGEPMGNAEHGHGIFTKCRPWPYDELVHIPTIIRGPGLPAGSRLTAFVQDCDCAPTVLDWLGVNIPEYMTGKSLLPLMRGEVEKVRDFAVAGYYNASWSIITDEWVYIHWLQKGTNAGFIDSLGLMMGGNSDMLDTNSMVGDSQPSTETESYIEAHTLDGEQWTCTPGARRELHDSDELYNRKSDPHQLNNVIQEHPELSEKLYDTLREYLSEIRAS